MVDDDLVRELRKLHRELAELAQSFSVPYDATARFDGHDATGVVYVAVDGDGRVRDANLHQSWREWLAADSFGGAVREAVDAADHHRLAAWLSAADSDPPVSRTVAEPGTEGSLVGLGGPPTSTGVPQGEASPVTAGDPVDELMRRFDKAEADLARFAHDVEQLVGREVTGRGRQRGITVSVTATGALTDAAVREAWLATARHGDVVAELRGAFRAAYDAADQMARDVLGSRPSPAG